MPKTLKNPKIASIVPKWHLSEIEGDAYMLVLGHVAMCPEGRDFYNMQSTKGSYVIVDSPVVEFGEPWPIRSLLMAAAKVRATEVVIPDWFQDANKTLKEAEQAVEIVVGHMKFKLMAVPQGRTRDEWVGCARELLKLPINTLGISYRYLEMFGNDRLLALDSIMADLGDKKVHFLGCMDDPREDIAKVIELDQIQGIDSAVAALFTKHRMAWCPGMERPERNIDFLKDEYDKVLFRMNLDSWRHACRDVK